MAWTETDEARLQAMYEVRYSGVRAVSYEGGKRVEYEPGESLDSAISKLEARKAAATSPRPVAGFASFRRAR